MSTIEIHFDKRINNVAVVREPDVKQRCEYVLVTLLATLFGLSLLFYAWQHYQYIQYGYRIADAQKQKDFLADRRESLQLERASLRNRQRIDLMARKLGMVAPVAGQWVTLSTDAPFTIPAPADNAAPSLSAKNAVQQ